MTGGSLGFSWLFMEYIRTGGEDAFNKSAKTIKVSSVFVSETHISSKKNTLLFQKSIR